MRILILWLMLSWIGIDTATGDDADTASVSEIILDEPTTIPASDDLTEEEELALLKFDEQRNDDEDNEKTETMIKQLNIESSELDTKIYQWDSFIQQQIKQKAELESLEAMERDLEARTLALQASIQKFQMDQTLRLAKRIENVWDDELRRRKVYEDWHVAEAAEKEAKAAAAAEANDETPGEGQKIENMIPIDELQNSLNIESVWDSNLLRLQRWLLDHSRAELLAAVETERNMSQTDLEIAYESMIDELKNSILTMEEEKDDHDIADIGGTLENCMTPKEVAAVVRDALITFATDPEGGFPLDHAQKGDIVYLHDWTSKTYDPHERLFVPMGDVWWRRFIPEDWEALMPPGWEHWNVGSVRLPDWLYHSLGVSGSPTLDAHAILESNTNVGSCWPMSGSSGRVTIRLSDPVAIHSVTIDHFPKLKNDNGSAPRYFRVVGYPLCEEEDQCSKTLGFDISRPKELGSFEYRRAAPRFNGGDNEEDEHFPSVQTFVIDPIAMASTSVEGEEPDPTSCGMSSSTEEVGSCGGDGNDMLWGTSPASSNDDDGDLVDYFAAVTLFIDENWGNNDYTCIYRFRIHGESSPQ